MYTLVAKDWRALSKAASQEPDPNKFMDLIEQLNEALDQQYGDADNASDGESETQFEAA